jgi:hypothetical protein
MTLISALKAYSELSNRHLKIRDENFCARNWQNPLGSFFAPLNDDFSAQDSRRIVSIEPTGNTDSEYVLKIALRCM